MDAEEALNNQDYASAHQLYNRLFEHAEKSSLVFVGVGFFLSFLLVGSG